MTPTVSGKYADVIENNVCKNIGFGKPSVNDTNALTSGVGCAAIFAGMGTSLPNTIVKNNVVQNCVETGIEGPYELVYHNTVKIQAKIPLRVIPALQRRYILS